MRRFPDAWEPEPNTHHKNEPRKIATIMLIIVIAGCLFGFLVVWLFG